MRRKAYALVALLTVLGLVATSFLLGASAGAPTRHARLSGAEEVPGPGDEDGRGRAVVRLNAGAGKVCFSIRWRDIAAPTAAHIHAGERGVAGGIVVGLFQSEMPLPATIHKVAGCVEAASELIDDIRRNPQNYYVNVHNADFPAGAIRGQLSKRRN